MNRFFRRAVWALVSCTFVGLPAALSQPIGAPGNKSTQPPGKAIDPPAATGQGTQPPVTPPATQDTTASNTGPQKDETVDAAAALFKEGKEEEAYKKLQEAATKNPNLPPARLMLHRMYQNSSKFPQARQAIELAAVENPDHPDIYMTLGNYALLEQRLTDAVLEFEKALSVINTGTRWNDAQKKSVRLNALNGLARASENRGQWDAAKKHVEEMLKLEFTKQQLAPVRAQLGRIYFMMDNRDQALKELEQAATDEPTMEPPGVSMGRLFTGKANAERDKAKQKQHFDKAREWFEYAVKKDPKSFKAHIAYAIWLFDMNYTDPKYLQLAEDELREAARLDPKHMDVRVLRGLIQRWTGNHAAAEAEFEALLKDHPNDPNLTNQLVLAMLEQKEQGKMQRALEVANENYRRTMGRAPDITATYGWALFKNNRLDEAEAALRQALGAGQTSSDPVYYYSQVLRFRGQLDDAVKALKAATTSSGRFMYRKEAMRDLSQLVPTGSGQ